MQQLDIICGSIFRNLLLLILLTVLPSSLRAEKTSSCSYQQAGIKNIYWGDLHVHSAYSLDAWSFGTNKTPREAYQFARGASIELADGSTAKLDRALDFVAVTDHAEWFDLLHICSDPDWSDDAYCTDLTTKNNPNSGIELFRDYVVTTITGDKPRQTTLCTGNQQHCRKASLSQWHRIQDQANAANDPCNFTTFIGYEWSATPSGSHTHRNLIFSNDKVTREAIDYIRYEKLGQLFTELEAQCTIDAGCEVLSIPHNANMGDGRGFDVEIEDEQTLRLRQKYEKLVEIHQEKGNSECLPKFGTRDDDDCIFEIRLTSQSRPKVNFEEAPWEKMRSTYTRSLLLRGLAAYKSETGENPLQLGILGSTDNHTATPGFVSESAWAGPVFGLGDFDSTMRRLSFNPGGLVAVWAEENTRASIFSALQRREVYATSGPRIRLKFSAALNGAALSCEAHGTYQSVPMGSEFKHTRQAPKFLINALYDRVPLAKIEIIKGEYKDGKLKESVIEVWSNPGRGLSVCETWQDDQFDASAPAFWYARVKQVPSARWSALLCKEQGRCSEYPAAVQTIEERAWSSPIWYLP